MGHFILIMICTFSGHGVSIATASFTDKPSCEAAGKAFSAQGNSWFLTSTYSCNEGGV